MPRSPDSDWGSARFALRRAFGLPTSEPGWYRLALEPSAAARIGESVRRARRGPRTRPPSRVAILLGPTPRSGTNYVEALIAAHPLVAAGPLGLRELPALCEADRLAPFARALAARHGSNAALGGEDWLGFALAGLLSRASAERPDAEVILLKDPHVRRLDLLPAVLPDATPIIVLRDGRRTIDSAAATWPRRGLRRWLGRSFADLCRDWAMATEAALDFAAATPGVITLRFEDAVASPSAVAARLWEALDLEADSEAEHAAAAAPVLGSSTHSRGSGGVDWRPRPKPADFDPAVRPLDWSSRRCRVFDRYAGAAEARLEREAPAAILAASAATDGAAFASIPESAIA